MAYFHPPLPLVVPSLHLPLQTTDRFQPYPLHRGLIPSTSTKSGESSHDALVVCFIQHTYAAVGRREGGRRWAAKSASYSESFVAIECPTVTTRSLFLPKAKRMEYSGRSWPLPLMLLRKVGISSSKWQARRSQAIVRMFYPSKVSALVNK